MFTKYIKASLAVLSFLVAVSCGVNEYSLESPDGRTCVKVLSGERLEYSITHDGSVLISPSAMEMEFVIEGKVLARDS